MTTAKSELSFLKRSSVSVSVSESGIVMMGWHDAGPADREGFAVGVELEELLAVDHARHVVDVAVDHEELVVGRHRDLFANALVALVEAEVDDAVARRHGARHQVVFKPHHVRDGGVLEGRDDARLGARLDRRDHVLVGDLVLILSGTLHHAHDCVGERRESHTRGLSSAMRVTIGRMQRTAPFRGSSWRRASE